MRRRDVGEQFRTFSSGTAYWLVVGSAILSTIFVLMTASMIFVLVVSPAGSLYALLVCLLDSCMFGALFLLWLKVYRRRRDEENTARCRDHRVLPDSAT